MKKSFVFLLASFLFLGFQTTGSLGLASESSQNRLKATFSVDADGNPKATVAAPNELFGGFLESDIQGSVQQCKDLKVEIEMLFTGKLKKIELTGNAFNITLTKSAVDLFEIETEKAAPSTSLFQMRKLLSKWCNFIESI